MSPFLTNNRIREVICIFFIWTRIITGAVPNNSPSRSLQVSDWIKAKCGRAGRQLWSYQGKLYDPLDGREVASVHGLEYAYVVPNSQIDQLEISKPLNNPNATFQTAMTVSSKNIFCYTLNGEKPLREMRVRPTSPIKQIPLDQAVGVYQTATTYIEKPDGELVVHSEWPISTQQKVSLWGTASSHSDNEEMGFSVYAKRRSAKSPGYLPDLTSTTRVEQSNETLSVSPKRSRWIQFGMGDSESKHKFGVRETYSMRRVQDEGRNFARRRWLPWTRRSPRDETSTPQLTYTRYGEGPPFYAPGRMCMLELQAQPIDSIQQASPILQDLIRDHIRGWTNTANATNEIFPSGTQALQLSNEGDEQDLKRKEYQGKVFALWDRVRRASNIVQVARNELKCW